MHFNTFKLCRLEKSLFVKGVFSPYVHFSILPNFLISKLSAEWRNRVGIYYSSNCHRLTIHMLPDASNWFCHFSRKLISSTSSKRFFSRARIATDISLPFMGHELKFIEPKLRDMSNIEPNHQMSVLFTITTLVQFAVTLPGKLQFA